jgi:23S rRNA (pseudouridine1915-N3)-methyltransferase
LRITLATIGKLKSGPERELCQRYLERFIQLSRALNFEPPRVLESSESQLRRCEERQAEEAKFFSQNFDDKTFVIALDERGKQLTSPDFSNLIAKERDNGRADLAVLIGGPDGFDASIRSRANLVLSFGAMTIPHQLVRVLLMEQLYRAATIMSNHPYHRE